MKNLLIIFTALFIMGCEKNDFDDDILIENEEPITQIPETLYGESYLNQRSGISFLWGGPAGGGVYQPILQIWEITLKDLMGLTKEMHTTM